MEQQRGSVSTPSDKPDLLELAAMWCEGAAKIESSEGVAAIWRTRAKMLRDGYQPMLVKAQLSAIGERFVWAVENKTSFVLFASEDLAKRYVSSFPASVGGGMAVARLSVCSAPTDRYGKDQA